MTKIFVNVLEKLENQKLMTDPLIWASIILMAFLIEIIWRNFRKNLNE